MDWLDEVIIGYLAPTRFYSENDAPTFLLLPGATSVPPSVIVVAFWW
jgi:hypothetical protein